MCESGKAFPYKHNKKHRKPPAKQTAEGGVNKYRNEIKIIVYLRLLQYELVILHR